MVGAMIGYLWNKEDANGIHCTDSVATGRPGEPAKFAGLGVGGEGNVTVEPSWKYLTNCKRSHSPVDMYARAVLPTAISAWRRRHGLQEGTKQPGNPRRPIAGRRVPRIVKRDGDGCH